ncbi:hypothetical protein [Nostoc sp. LPT]|nr:hypothetical protein [Nostoc sp. LPT]
MQQVFETIISMLETRPIRTEADYRAALDEIEKLIQPYPLMQNSA